MLRTRQLFDFMRSYHVSGREIQPARLGNMGQETLQGFRPFRDGVTSLRGVSINANRERFWSTIPNLPHQTRTDLVPSPQYRITAVIVELKLRGYAIRV